MATLATGYTAQTAIPAPGSGRSGRGDRPASQGAALPLHEAHGALADSVSPASASVASAHPAYERGAYRASRASGPLALVASAGVMLAFLAVLATLGVVHKQEARKRLHVVTMRNLDTTPPPPPPPAAAPELDPDPAPAQAVVPKPMIALPAPGPAQVMVDAPPPPAPPAPPGPAAASTAAPAAPARAAAAVRDAGDLSGTLVEARPPTYPPESRRAREEGTVKLRLLVGPDGRVAEIEVAASSGSRRLDRAALQAVRRWRWSPVTAGGEAVAVRGYVTIPFKLTA